MAGEEDHTPEEIAAIADSITGRKTVRDDVSQAIAAVLADEDAER